jgi:hypothetical protein
MIEGKIAAKPHAKLHPATGVYEFIAVEKETFSHGSPDESKVKSHLPRAAFRPKQPPAEGPMSVEQVAGDVMLDCDYYDIERRARADEEGCLGYTRAYFLVLGRLEWPQSNRLGMRACPMDVGLALRRVVGVGDESGDRFERIGVFWHASDQYGLFNEAQPLDFVLV